MNASPPPPPPLRRHALPLRLLRARPRLTLCLVLGLAAAFVVPDTLAQRTVTRMIVGWNAGAWLYLLLAARAMLAGASPEQMRQVARAQDEGRLTVLVLVVLAVLACLGAIVAELALARELHGRLRAGHAALALLTIVSAWAFTHTMFAQYYAHDYYNAIDRGHAGGLLFPGTDGPDDLDFLYFAMIIGTSAQTADVSLSTPRMRRLVLVHCVLSFFFNTTVLALSINVASGFF